MNTSSILDEAEQRIASATTQARTTHAEIIEAMREEIGRQHYAQATIELPKLEQLIAREVRPYLDHLMRISQQATVPLRSDIMAYVRELQEGCVSGADWVRAGIDEWNRLTPPFMPGTQQIDLSRRAAEVYGVRTKLMNWDGKESRLRVLMTYIDNYIQESRWPSGQPGPSTLTKEV